MPGEYQRQLLQAPTGMASALDAAVVPLNRARSLIGFLPARTGVNVPVPELRALAQGFANPITSVHVWRNPSATSLYSSQLLYAVNNAGTMEVYACPMPTLTMNAGPDGPHSYWGTLTPTLVSAGVDPAVGRLHSVQFKDELYLFDSAGQGFRFYQSGSTNHWHLLGIPAPSAPVNMGTDVGVLNGVYQYVTTFVDERGRESSPSASLTTQNLVDRQIQVGLDGSWSSRGVVSWNLYRRNPGSETYNFVANMSLADLTVTYWDNIADATVALSAAAPDAGQNDAPLAATFGAVWNGRLVLNSVTDRHLVQISNADAPTQFASFSDPSDNPADGLRLVCSGGRGGEVSGFANLGSYLAIFTRTDIFLLQGEDNATFYRQHVHEIGCAAPASIQRVRNMVYFLGDDTVYQIGYAQGLLVEPVSVEIRDWFEGFVAKHDPPLHPNDYQSVVQANSMLDKVCAWAADDRYYLSTLKGTLVYDTIAGGWADTGYGFLCSVATLEGGTDWANTSLPPALFALPGDTYASGSDTLNANRILVTKQDDRPTDAVVHPEAVRSIVRRPYDGMQLDPHGRTKRASRYRVWGTTGAARGARIGTLWLQTDRGVERSYPIQVGLKQYEPGVLYEQQMPADAVGRVLWLEEQYITNDVEPGSSMLQYDPVGR